MCVDELELQVVSMDKMRGINPSLYLLHANTASFPTR